MLQWDGLSWNEVTPITLATLYSDFMVSPNDGWAVGSGGEIIRWTGTEWIPEFPAPAIALLAIALAQIGLCSVLKKRKTISQ